MTEAEEIEKLRRENKRLIGKLNRMTFKRDEALKEVNELRISLLQIRKHVQFVFGLRAKVAAVDLTKDYAINMQEAICRALDRVYDGVAYWKRLSGDVPNNNKIRVDYHV